MKAGMSKRPKSNAAPRDSRQRNRRTRSFNRLEYANKSPHANQRTSVVPRTWPCEPGIERLRLSVGGRSVREMIDQFQMKMKEWIGLGPVKSATAPSPKRQLGQRS